MNEYDPKQIEPKWQKVWEETKPFEAKDNSDKPKYYALVEFPYPSGDGLHTGHVRSYTALDVVTRKRRMEGFNVMYPIGWDAFGLPAENYAIKTGIQPAITTQKNIENYRKQLKSLGILFDWSREVDTTDPKYYKWTQWIFLQFLKHDLAYKAKMEINWCPKDKIGLANEEVINGKCERCGTVVEKREKEQWMLAITKYADRLDKDLDTVDYQERIKLQQRNWIGRSEGAEIKFELDFKKNPKDNERRGADGEKAALAVFTTRPDTIFGATYLVLAPEHLWVTLAIDDNHDVLENKDEVKAYLASVKGKEEIERTAAGKEKTGIELKGVKAINPATKEEISIWVADYVLPHYGTGAIMAVPAHDERDNTFAKKYNLPIRDVIIPSVIDHKNPPQEGKENTLRKIILAVVHDPKTDRYLCLKWKHQPWTTFVTGGVEEGEDVVEAAAREVAEETGYTNVKLVRKLGAPTESQFYAAHKGVNRKVNNQNILFELVDDARSEISGEDKDQYDILWLTKEEVMKAGLQHAEFGIVWDRIQSGNDIYSGDGVLIDSGEFTGVPSEEAKKAIADAVGGKIVTKFKLRDWIFSRQRYWGEPIPVIHCEKCGIVPVPEKDLPVTLPKVEMYEPTDNGESPLSSIDSWVNVECPTCGEKGKRETDTMPNWAGSSWYFLRYCDPHNNEQFASPEKLKEWMSVDWYNGGMEHTTLHLLYSRFWNKFLFDVGLVPTAEPYAKRTSHGLILAEGGVKMSKSLGNVVNPDKIVDMFGADTLRVYEMFMGPFEQAIAWSEASLVGPRRFIERVWKLRDKIGKGETLSIDPQGLTFAGEVVMNQTIKKVSEDIETLGFNTAVSSLMVYTNALEKMEAVSTEEYQTLLKLLSPFAPHVSEELWSLLGHTKSIAFEPWPTYDSTKLTSLTKTIAVQINGKVRATVETVSDDTEASVKDRVLTLPEVQKWLNGATPSKVIIILGKVVNLVV